MNREYTLHDDTVETLISAAVALNRSQSANDHDLITAVRTLAMQNPDIETPYNDN